VLNEQTGLVVPAKNIDALAHAVLRLLNDSELRANMGKAGRERAQELFGIDSVVKTHLDIYADIMRT
jgi:glycosyltransferase involved in cell wall biosynthesis